MKKKATTFVIRVTPNSQKNSFLGVSDGVIKIKIKAAPEKNRANKELITFLSKILKVPKSDIKIVIGKTNKTKLIKIDGIDRETLINALKKYL